MGSYASLAVRDAQGNITGYQSTTTGQIVETTGAASPAFQAAQAQYTAQKYAVVGSSPTYQQGSFQPYDPSGDVGISGRAAVQAQQWQPLQQSQVSVSLENQPSRSTVPIRDLSSRMPDPIYADSSPGYTPGTNIYMAAGGYQTVRLADAKIVAGRDTGEFGVYQPSYDPNTGQMRRALSLVGGGGRAALQSGMFSKEESMAPASKTYEQWEIGKINAVSKEYADTHSRLGAEAYGGFSKELTGALLTPDSQMSTYANPNNLANLANPQGANMSKVDAPGVNIPWQIGVGSPQVQYADEKGLTGRGYNFTEVTERAMVAGTIPKPFISVGKAGVVTASVEQATPSTTQVKGVGAAFVPKSAEGVEAGMAMGEIPKPFRSDGETAAQPSTSKEEFDSSKGFIAGLLPDIEPERVAAWQIANSRKSGFEVAMETQRAGFDASASAFGGALSAVIVGITGKGTIVEKGTEPKYTISETTTTTGGSPEIVKLGDWLTANKATLDLTDKSAVSTYNEKVKLYNTLQEQNPIIEKTTTVKTPIPGTGRPDKIYEYGEWSKFVEGSGRVARYLTGTPLDKQAAYYETIKNESGALGEAKRGVFFVATEVINKPAALAPAAIQGAAFVYGGAGLGAVTASVAGGTSRAAPVAQWLVSPTGQTVVKAGVASFFTTLYGLEVTEGFTATTEKTKENIYRSAPTLVAMYAGGGGFNELPSTVRRGVIAIDARMGVPMDNARGSLGSGGELNIKTQSELNPSSRVGVKPEVTLREIAEARVARASEMKRIEPTIVKESFEVQTQSEAITSKRTIGQKPDVTLREIAEARSIRASERTTIEKTPVQSGIAFEVPPQVEVAPVKRTIGTKPAVTLREIAEARTGRFTSTPKIETKIQPPIEPKVRKPFEMKTYPEVNPKLRTVGQKPTVTLREIAEARSGRVKSRTKASPQNAAPLEKPMSLPENYGKTKSSQTDYRTKPPKISEPSIIDYSRRQPEIQSESKPRSRTVYKEPIALNIRTRSNIMSEAEAIINKPVEGIRTELGKVEAGRIGGSGEIEIIRTKEIEVGGIEKQRLKSDFEIREMERQTQRAEMETQRESFEKYDIEKEKIRQSEIEKSGKERYKELTIERMRGSLEKEKLREQTSQKEKVYQVGVERYADLVKVREREKLVGEVEREKSAVKERGREREKERERLRVVELTPERGSERLRELELVSIQEVGRIKEKVRERESEKYYNPSEKLKEITRENENVKEREIVKELEKVNEVPKQEEIVKPIPPLPIIPIIPPFPLPWGGGGGGTGASLKPRGPRKTEWFGYAPGNIDVLMSKSAKRAGKYLATKGTKYHW